MILLLLFGLCSTASPTVEHAFSFDLENDSRNLLGPNSDQAYTGGFRAAALEEQTSPPLWLKQMSSAEKATLGFAIGEQVYTPDNITSAAPVTSDRPYAAWLYGGFTSNLLSEFRSQLVEVDLGVIGPDASGVNIQNGIHQAIGDQDAKGWNNQLGTEPTIQAYFEDRHRLRREKYYDVIQFQGLALGNVFVNAEYGGLMRLGFSELPRDFGSTRASSGNGEAFVPRGTLAAPRPCTYFFLGGKTTAVARNIFLDGSTFQQSLRVTKYLLVAETEFGIGQQFADWSIVWHFVTRSPEFAENSAFNSFASVSTLFTFR